MNTSYIIKHYRRIKSVQIPLWSMNTSYTVIGCVGQLGSDSSMVDEYLYYVLASRPSVRFRFLYGRWIRCRYSDRITGGRVQIPLWSMNTNCQGSCRIFSGRFRFLYGRWILDLEVFYNLIWTRSDSSMVDEYASAGSATMWAGTFRFLYGRWILPQAGALWSLQAVQIPLWSMNTQ